MRLPILILELCLVLAGNAWAQTQNAAEGGGAPQLPVGQVFKQFEFPAYEGGKLKYTLFATEAKGITLNRAETTDLKIDVYDNGAVSTTITSPKADLLVTEQKMRTKNTVSIERSDMSASAQNCDFDVKSKKFVMRTNVKVVLKHFDLASNPNGTTPKPAATTAAQPAPAAPAPPTPAPSAPDVPMTPAPAHGSADSLLTSPGTYADTNSAPLPPSNSETK